MTAHAPGPETSPSRDCLRLGDVLVLIVGLGSGFGAVRWFVKTQSWTPQRPAVLGLPSIGFVLIALTIADVAIRCNRPRRRIVSEPGFQVAIGVGLCLGAWLLTMMVPLCVFRGPFFFREVDPGEIRFLAWMLIIRSARPS